MEVEQYIYSHPTSFIVTGATQSGKSSFCKNLLVYKDTLFEPTPKATYLIYKIWQPIYSEMEKLGLVTKFIHGIPEMDTLIEILSSHTNEGGSILIFDDIGSEIKDHITNFIQLFTVYSHHLK